MISLIKLTENDKRLIIVLLLIIILFFVIVGYVGLLVRKIMKFQAKKADDMLNDVVRAGVITEERKLWLFGIRKNWRVFFKQAWLPFLIIITSITILIIYCASMNNWDVNVWDYKEEGFGTLFHIFDWDNAPRAKFFGVEIICDWPEVISTPHFSWKAWGSYLFVPGMFIGGIWFLIYVQAYIARAFRIKKLSKTVFRKSLDDYNANENVRSPIKPE